MGIQTITTWNAAANDPMLALNDRPGFERHRRASALEKD
jgi:hypothetical protein